MLKTLSLTGFLEATASDAPVPGGGSVAALSGALAAALGEMVARLTLGKAKYAAVETTMAELAQTLEDHRNAFVDLIDEDAASFDGVMKAFRLPKETDEEKQHRQDAIQNGMKAAAEVPLKVAHRCVELMPLFMTLVEKGNQNAVTDGAVAAMMCRTAALSALLNVRINLASIKDGTYVESLSSQCETIETQVRAEETAILGSLSF